MNTIKLNGVTIEIGAASIHIDEVEVDAIDLIATIASFQGEAEEPFAFTPLFDGIFKQPIQKAENPFKQEKHTDSKGWEKKDDGNSPNPFFNPFGDESLGNKQKSVSIEDLLDLATKSAPFLKSGLGTTQEKILPLTEMISMISSLQNKLGK